LPDGGYLLVKPGLRGALIAREQGAWFSDADAVGEVINEWHSALKRERWPEPSKHWMTLAKFCLFQERIVESRVFAAHWAKARGLEATVSRRFVFVHKPKSEMLPTASSHLEAVVDWLLAEFPPAGDARPGCVVFLLPDETAAHALGRSGPVSGVIAWYLSLQKEIVLLDWSMMSTKANLAALTRVAAQHYLIDVYLAGCLVQRCWVIDGLASYLQGLVVKGGKASGVRGKDREHLERIKINLKAGTHTPIEKFLGLRFTDIVGGDVYYVFPAQAWSMVWYLLEPGKKETGDLLGRFLERLRSLKDEEQAWAETFGRCDLKQLEEAWRKALLAG